MSMNETNQKALLRDPLEHLLSYQLRRAALSTMIALTDAFAELGLAQTEVIIIRFVKANPGCTQADIGRAIGVKRTNMVPIVNGLMAKGVLDRSAVDGRSHALYLTSKGVKLHNKIAKISAEHEAFFFGDVPGEVREILMQVFRSLRAKAEQRT
ncbi:MAG: MarR family winged helix-turn-helix transcriptional regulator [Spongiibacteraceae bacterium]